MAPQNDDTTTELGFDRNGAGRNGSTAMKLAAKDTDVAGREGPTASRARGVTWSTASALPAKDTDNAAESGS